MALTSSLLQGVTFNEIHMQPDGISQDLDGSGFGDSGDEFIELYNSSLSAVDLEGWELRDGNVLIHTFKPGDSIPAGGFFTLVDPSGAGPALQNVGLPAEFFDAVSVTFSASDTFTLYDPDSDEYIVIAGDTAIPGSIAAAQTTVENAHTTASRSGNIEVLPATTLGNSAHRASDGDEVWTSDGPTPGTANCFARGTLIATPCGEIPVENLAIGDLVATPDGRQVPVRWIGRQTLSKDFFKERSQLVRITASALGNHSDLYVTGDHGMVLDGYLINASALVNGCSIDWVPMSDTPERQTVYHIETMAHDIILANGAASETYLDIPGRMAFDNYQEYLDLYGNERTISENHLPRILSARHVPSIFRRMAAVDAA